MCKAQQTTRRTFRSGTNRELFNLQAEDGDVIPDVEEAAEDFQAETDADKKTAEVTNSKKAAKMSMQAQMSTEKTRTRTTK